MKISVIGSGYVGLVTGTCFAEIGNTVTCIDIDPKKVEILKSGKIPIFEPGLNLLFKRNTKEKRLHFTTNLKEGIKGAKVIFLALPTPAGKDGSADLKYILKVAHDLGPILENYTVIIDKSTVPVGTAEKVTAAIAKNTTVDFDVISNPEFLREGVAVGDFMKPDRVVIGSDSEKANNIIKQLYEPLVQQESTLIFMDKKSAELTKYASNSFLATKITFMNEIANLCELLGANVDMVRKGVGTDPRIGKNFLLSGIGYGGSCFPKDVEALLKSAKDVNYDFGILNAIINTNSTQKIKLIPKIKAYFKGSLKGKKIAMWGLAFKPYTDDIREASALANIDELLREGAEVQAFDPEAMENTKNLIGDKISYASNQYEALQGADALLIVTEWPSFKSPNFDKIKLLLTNKVIFDGRNIYKPIEMKKLGFNYYSIGREHV